jgi:hypothetical protein
VSDEWSAGTDPQAMLGSLRGGGRAGARKLRLFACACVRRVWPLLVDGRSRGAVEAAEREADGLAADREMDLAACEAEEVWKQPAHRQEDLTAAEHDAAVAAFWACAADAFAAALHASYKVEDAARSNPRRAGERVAQCRLLRDVFGDTVGPPTPLDRAVLEWSESIVQRLALAAYEDRLLPLGALDPERLAVLADALDEAGCTDVGMLNHLRGPGPHVRGCWAVDLLLLQKS